MVEGSRSCEESIVKLDIFLSICQTEVDGHTPNEKQMFENFFDQLTLADELGFGTAWVAETHLSCEVQKQGPNAVIPHFKGEIGLNTDILQLAHVAFARTRQIGIGSAIRNILCNGGPIAHAEAIQTALSLMSVSNLERNLEIGFASGRFEFSNRPYGIVPRNEFEKSTWPVIKGKILKQATEIFLRLLNGEQLASTDLQPVLVSKQDFRDEESWQKAGAPESKPLENFWNFERLGVIPREVEQKNLVLTLGSHDPDLQIFANQFRPVRIFNLSITPPHVIEETHQRMQKHYHGSGGPWQRWYMPRTAMVFLDKSDAKAKEMAKKAWENYWRAMDGTLDSAKVEAAVTNSVAGDADRVVEILNEKYRSDERLMLWFDFNNHDNDYIKLQMKHFMEKVAPCLR